MRCGGVAREIPIRDHYRKKMRQHPCLSKGGVPYCCSAVSRLRCPAALLGRFLPRLGPLASVSGLFLFQGTEKADFRQKIARLRVAVFLGMRASRAEITRESFLHRSVRHTPRAAARLYSAAVCQVLPGSSDSVESAWARAARSCRSASNPVVR